jgi:hypothetical protein
MEDIPMEQNNQTRSKYIIKIFKQRVLGNIPSKKKPLCSPLEIHNLQSWLIPNHTPNGGF